MCSLRVHVHVKNSDCPSRTVVVAFLLAVTASVVTMETDSQATDKGKKKNKSSSKEAKR